jgi:hypothetical protein
VITVVNEDITVADFVDWGFAVCPVNPVELTEQE